MRSVSLLLLAICVTGCSGLHQGTNLSAAQGISSEEPIFLTSAEARQANLQEFLNTNEVYTEQEKINYLLNVVRTSDTTFVRNGDHYTGVLAARWLRWKMMHRQYKDNPIVTSRDFVERVCLQSNRTGIPYEVILVNKDRHRLQPLMANELAALENAIRQESLTQAVSTNGTVSSGGDTISIPMIMPASH